MDTNILTQQPTDVKDFILADGIYPYDDPEDHFVVIIGGEEVAWTETQAQAERSFIELIHYDALHQQKCPSDYIPFTGEPVPYESEADDYGLGAAL